MKLELPFQGIRGSRLRSSRNHQNVRKTGASWPVRRRVRGCTRLGTDAPRRSMPAIKCFKMFHTRMHVHIHPYSHCHSLRDGAAIPFYNSFRKVLQFPHRKLQVKTSSSYGSTSTLLHNAALDRCAMLIPSIM